MSKYVENLFGMKVAKPLLFGIRYNKILVIYRGGAFI